MTGGESRRRRRRTAGQYPAGVERPASTDRRADRFGVVALAASGTLAGHQLGYLTDAESRAAHGYLAVVGPVVVLLGFVAAWIAAVRILRRDAGVAPTFFRLGVAQVGLYGAMEILERIGGDGYGALWSVPVLLGLLAQPVVAWVALRVLRISARVIDALASARPPSTTRRPLRRPVDVAHRVARLRPAAIHPRGPPAVLITTV